MRRTNCCVSNPKLVIVRISGWGQTGPYHRRPGFGTLVEGFSGFAEMNGFPDREPVLPPMYLADALSGLSGAFAAMAALREVEINGGTRPGRRPAAARSRSSIHWGRKRRITASPASSSSAAAAVRADRCRATSIGRSTAAGFACRRPRRAWRCACCVRSDGPSFATIRVSRPTNSASFMSSNSTGSSAISSARERWTTMWRSSKPPK